MSGSAVKRVFVTGGTGFLGYRICRALALRGFEVIALSRSGSHPMTPRPAWSSSVTWLKGDCLNPSTYENAIKNADAVVHSVGALFEDSRYKSAINMDKGLLNSVQVVATMAADQAKNLLGQAPRNEKQEKSHLEIINRDTALSVAEAFEKAKLSSVPGTMSPSTAPRAAFLLVSASQWLPSQVVDKRYTSSKLEAENGVKSIASRSNAFRPIIFRPSLMYDESRPISIPLAGLNSIAKRIESMVGVRQSQIYAPIRTDRVAEAICGALAGPDVSGIYGVEDIERLADEVPSGMAGR